MTIRHRSWFLLAVLATSCGPAYKPKLDSGYKLDATDFPFPSGLRVIFQRDPGQPSVLVSTVIDAGSAADPEGMEGLAHLVEHLCFRAKRGGGALSVREEITRLGAGTFNASTRDDFTDYYTLGPRAALVPLLQIEANRLLDPLVGVTEEMLATEREVVRNELRMRTENTLAYRLYELSKSSVFPKGHRYHRSGIGSHESLDAITLADLQAWVKKHYIAPNTTIVVAGDFPQADLGAILNRALPRELVSKESSTEQRLTLRVPEPRVVDASPDPPAPADTTLRRVEGPVQRETLLLAWSLPGGYRENDALIELTVLTMSFALREKLGPQFGLRRKDRIEALGCSSILNRDASIAVCTIEIAKGQSAEDISKRALKGLESLHEWRLGETYLYKYAKQWQQARLFRESASIWRGQRIAEYAHFRGRADFFAGSIDRWSKVEPKQSHLLAEKYLRPERAVRVLVTPYSGEDKGRANTAFAPGSSWAGDTLDPMRDVSWITNGALAAVTTTPDLGTVRTAELPNGLRLVVKRHASAPFVRVGLLTHGGRASAKPWGLPDFLIRRSSSRTPEEIAGTWIGSQYGDAEMLGVETPSGNLDEALDIVYDRATSMQLSWSKSHFEPTQAARRKRAKERAPSAARSAERAFWKTLYPGHAFGRRSYDIQALRDLSDSEAREYTSNHFSPQNAVLFVVGNVDPADVEARVAKMWSGWRKWNPGKRDPGFDPPRDPPAPAIVLLDEPEATQTSLTIGCHLAPFDGADAVEDVLVRKLRTELYTSIREKAGASYGVSVSTARASGGVHVLRVSTLVQNDKARPALETVVSRIRAIAAAEITAEGIAESKWQAAVETHTENLSSDEMLRTLVQLERDGRPVADLATYPERLAGVRASDIAAMLAPCAGREVITAVGPLSVIEAPLRGQGVTTTIVDWKNQSQDEFVDEDDDELE